MTPSFRRGAEAAAVRAALALALGLAVSLAACRGRGPDEAKGKPLTIAVVPMGTTHEFWKSIHAGAETAARELGRFSRDLSSAR